MARHTVKAVKAWTKPGASPVAAHCVPAGEGWALTVQGFRIIKPDGATWRPALAAFATEAAAQTMADRLDAPVMATLEAIRLEDLAAPKPCADLQAWISDTRSALLSDDRGEREAAAVEVRGLYLSSLPIGATGRVTLFEGAPMNVTTTEEPVDYCGRSATDATPWIGVSVRFSPVHGHGTVDVDSVAWDAVRL